MKTRINDLLLSMQCGEMCIGDTANALLGLFSDLQEEIKVTEELLSDRQRVLDVVPECEIHGRCVPYAIEWINKMKKLELKIRGEAD